MKIKFKEIGSLLKTAFKEWFSKDPFKESAVIAYYTIFSLPGLLVLIITLAGYLSGRESVTRKLSEQISSMMGPDTAQQIQDMIDKAGETKHSAWATAVGIVIILLG